MEHTSNYELSKWAESDRIQMEDFNMDHDKIDAALAAANAEKIVVGSYIGDGSNSVRTIDLGFTPKLVFVSGYASASHTRVTIAFGPYAQQFYNSGCYPYGNIAIVENGFTITGYEHNISEKEEHYFAIR